VGVLQWGGWESFVVTLLAIFDTTQIHKEMTMDANLEGSSQQAKQDAINRRNGQGPQHLKFFLLVFLKWRPRPNKSPSPTHDFIIHHASEDY